MDTDSHPTRLNLTFTWRILNGTEWTYFQAVAGLALFIFVAWLFSENRRHVNFKMVVTGLAVQVILAIIITKFGMIRSAFLWLGEGVMALKNATTAGTSLVFGYLGGGALPFPAHRRRKCLYLCFSSPADGYRD